MSSTFGYLPVASPLHTGEPLDRLIASYGAALAAHGGQRIDPKDVKEATPLLFFIVTGGTERQLFRYWQRRARVLPKVPAFLIAHQSQNSLPAALEVLARLHQEGASGRIVVLDGPDDQAGIDGVLAAVHDARTWLSLRSARIGLVGPPADWLIASSPSPAIVRETWGPEVAIIPVSELFEAMDQVDVDAATNLGTSLKESAIEVWEPTEGDISAAASAALALRALVGRRALTAVALRCFELILERETTGCLSLSLLNEQGIIAGCEGDLPSTLAMLWVRELVGQPSWMANPARIDRANNSLTLAHCTIVRNLVTGYHVRSHFETGLGVALQGEVFSTPGQVTLLRLGGKDLKRLWIAEGETLSTGEGPSEDLCRTQVTVRLTLGRVDELLRRPLGNHVVLVPGAHAERLESYWETLF